MTPRQRFCVEQILIAQSYFLYIIALSQHREINLHDNTFCYVCKYLIQYQRVKKNLIYKVFEHKVFQINRYQPLSKLFIL